MDDGEPSSLRRCREFRQRRSVMDTSSLASTGSVRCEASLSSARCYDVPGREHRPRRVGVASKLRDDVDRGKQLHPRSWRASGGWAGSPGQGRTGIRTKSDTILVRQGRSGESAFASHVPRDRLKLGILAPMDARRKRIALGIQRRLTNPCEPKRLDVSERAVGTRSRPPTGNNHPRDRRTASASSAFSWWA